MKESNIELLILLHKERLKFGDSDRKRMQFYVDELVDRGVYPSSGFNGAFTPLKMVECYGVDWHQFSIPHYCVYCGTDLRDWNIGAPGKREIIVKLLYENDMYKCPDCNCNITNYFYESCNRRNQNALTGD